MKGDRIVIEDHHRRAAARIVPLLREAIAGKKTGRYVITVAGESGSGKSETAQAIAEALAPTGVKAVVLGQDDYFVLPPRSNNARRRQDPEWLGPHVEVRLDVLEANLRDAIAGAGAVSKPLVDYDANAIGQETVDLAGVQVLVVEGTYVSLLRRVDTRVFIARSRRDTLEHRRKRNRGSEADDPFIEQVLATEHKIIAGHRQLADLVITRDFDVLSADEGARLP
jgi:uridine kinase